MKALKKVAVGKGNMCIVDCPIPEIYEDEALIKVSAVGVCGTDYHIYTDEYPTAPPLTLGHEFSGEVAKLGSRVTGLEIGDRVISELSVMSCGSCLHCKTGNSHICPSKRPPGSLIDGACAEYIKMPFKLIHKIPLSVTSEEAAVVEPAAIVVHSVLERAKVYVDDFVVINGAGAIGLISAQIARIAGARKIVILGTDSDEAFRFKIARKLGFSDLINVSKEDAVSKVNILSEGDGADLVIECSGAAPAINTGIDILRKHGRMCVIGIPGDELIRVKWKLAVFKAVEIIFNFSSSSTSWDIVLGLLSSKVLDLNILITHKASMDDWEAVFQKVGKGEVLKAILIPQV